MDIDSGAIKYTSTGAMLGMKRTARSTTAPTTAPRRTHTHTLPTPATRTYKHAPTLPRMMVKRQKENKSHRGDSEGKYQL